MGNEHHMAYGARFLFGTRPMIDFESGNEHYGGAFRYFGLGAIFPTQSLRAAGIWILSTQFFRLLLVLIVQFVAMSLRTGFFKFITHIEKIFWDRIINVIYTESGKEVLATQVWNYQYRRCIFTLLGHLDYIRTVR